MFYPLHSCYKHLNMLHNQLFDIVLWLILSIIYSYQIKSAPLADTLVTIEWWSLVKFLYEVTSTLYLFFLVPIIWSSWTFCLVVISCKSSSLFFPQSLASFFFFIQLFRVQIKITHQEICKACCFGYNIAHLLSQSLASPRQFSSCTLPRAYQDWIIAWPCGCPSLRTGL